MFTLKYIGNMGLRTWDEPCYNEIAHVKDGIVQVKYKSSRDRLLKMYFVDSTDEPSPEEDSHEGSGADGKLDVQVPV